MKIIHEKITPNGIERKMVMTRSEFVDRYGFDPLPSRPLPSRRSPEPVGRANGGHIESGRDSTCKFHESKP